MAFVVTPYRSSAPGNIFRFWSVTALDGDTGFSDPEPHGFPSNPQFVSVFAVDGDARVTTGQYAVDLNNTTKTFRVNKTLAGAGTGGTVRVCVGFIPGAFGV